MASRLAAGRPVKPNGVTCCGNVRTIDQSGLGGSVLLTLQWSPLSSFAVLHVCQVAERELELFQAPIKRQSSGIENVESPSTLWASPRYLPPPRRIVRV
jgi:hypothetical protein